ncbi:MAG: hypothetical protein MZW92_62865 [Comamonadaceae bacterium]|nr:hypothetical protein [Comamonadaceae bacterium]
MAEAGRHAAHYTIGPATRHGAAPTIRKPCSTTAPARCSKTLVERYIADGQPVGSRTLVARQRARPVAGDDPQRDGRPGRARPDRQPAHQRRPRAHRARLPAVRRHDAHGARRSTCARRRELAAAREQLHPDQPQRVIAQAALAAVEPVAASSASSPRRARPASFHHIEFLRLGERRVLVILVAPDGDVQNRVIFTARDYTQAELLEATQLPQRALRRPGDRGGARAAQGRGRRAARRDRGADAGRRCRPAPSDGR